MALPWLIGAAVVAAVAAVAKAVSDDDDSSSSSSGEAERQDQERRAERDRQRQRLETQLINLDKNHTEYTNEVLTRSIKALGKDLGVIKENTSIDNLHSALSSNKKSTSEYAEAIDSILKINNLSQSYYSSKESRGFLTNLKVIDNLPIGITLSDSERTDVEKIHSGVSRLERLQELKYRLEQQNLLTKQDNAGSRTELMASFQEFQD